MKKILLFLLVSSVFCLNLGAQIVFSEDFESGALPAGWQVITKSSDGGWKFGTASSLSSAPADVFHIPTSNGTKMAATNDDKCPTCDKSQDILVTDTIDLTGYSKLALSMDAYYFKGNYQGFVESFFVVGSIDGGATWTQLGEVPAAGDWNRAKIDISAVAGYSTVMIGFLYSDAGGWLYGAAIDNIAIEVPDPRDVQVTNITSKNYGIPGATRTISGLLYNNGSDTLKSVTIEWTDGVTPHQEEFTSISVPPYTSSSFELTAVVTLKAGEIPVNVTASKPNGLDDLDPSNDSKSTVFTGYVLNAKKGVLAEEATGTWCQWCPRGAVFMDFMKQEYGEQFVGVAVHNADPMVVASYDSGLGAFPGFSGYPSIVVNKKEFADSDVANFYLEEPFLKSASEVPAVEITATASYKKGTKDLTINASATSNTDMSGAKFFMTLIEDDVTGTGSDYDQVNVYSGSGISMGGFENLANPVPAADMVYNHVARALFGTYNGITGSITGTLQANVPQTYEYTGYTIPDAYEILNMHAVIGVLGSNNQVVNVIQVPLQEATSSNEVFNNNLASVSPNPFSNVTYVKLELSDAKEVSMKVFNSLGRVVASKDYGKISGSQNLPFYANDLANGIYFIHLQVNGELVTKQVILNK